MFSNICFISQPQSSTAADCIRTRKDARSAVRGVDLDPALKDLLALLRDDNEAALGLDAKKGLVLRSELLRVVLVIPRLLASRTRISCPPVPRIRKTHLMMRSTLVA